MYVIMIRIIVLAALIELGLSAQSLKDCLPRQCLGQLHKAFMQITNVDWKPISVFPNEAKRFN